MEISNNNLLMEVTPTGICNLILNRPELHNAFDNELIRNLFVTLQAIEREPKIKIVVLRSKGKSFSAGADLNWLRKVIDYSAQQNLDDAMDMAQMMKLLYNLKKPTIAVVQGSAMGGGAGLVACCDIAVASKHAEFAFPEVKLGLIPAVISPYVIAAIGQKNARRYFFTGETFSAEKAERIGLIHEYTEPENLENLLSSFTSKIIQNGPSAVKSAKHLINEVANNHLNDNMIRFTADEICIRRVSDEGHEGLCAFLEKRKPSWLNDND